MEKLSENIIGALNALICGENDIEGIQELLSSASAQNDAEFFYERMNDIGRDVIDNIAQHKYDNTFKEFGGKFLGYAKSQFVRSILSGLNNREEGREKLQRVIEIFADPARYPGREDKRKSVRTALNDILKYAGYGIDGLGKIITVDKPESENDLTDLSKIIPLHDLVKTHAEPQLINQDYNSAAFEVCKAFVQHVRSNSGLTEDGQSLMANAFRIGGPLKINDQASQAEKDEQDGYKFLAMGLVSAFRNPLGHETAIDKPITKEESVVIFAIVSLILNRLDNYDRS